MSLDQIVAIAHPLSIELLTQSQHAEKLLEINQNMLERDKALKLELDVATSLNKDMTMRLAVSQRTIKQLNEKLVAMDAAETTSREAHDAALHEKVSIPLLTPSVPSS